MLRLLRWLFTGDGHSHKWVKVKEYDIYGNGAKSTMATSSIWLMQCEHCGNLKKFKI